MKVYKVLRENEWRTFQEEGLFRGSEHDIRDGFIHLSESRQVSGVIERYFTDSRPIYVLEFENPEFIQKLKWELASNGDSFPHLYQEPLDIDLVSDVREII